jgi:hypothetical protein
MKCIEIINLRSAGDPRESIEQKIPGSTVEVDQSKDLVSIQVYRHATLDTDLSVHLLFESSKQEMQPSALGQRLASALKDFGLVSHSMWVEQEKPEQSE